MEKSDQRHFNRLYRNDGNGKFSDVAEAAGVRGEGYGMGVATADYDNDGLLDLIVINYIRWDIDNEPECKTGNIRAYCSPNSYQGEPNMLFHNNGDGTVTDVAESSGIGKLIGKGMGVAFADYDGDGFTDVFVSKDTFLNFLFHNNGNGSELAIVGGVAYNENGKSIAGMGTDLRDIDNDGRPDIFVVSMIGDTPAPPPPRQHGVLASWTSTTTGSKTYSPPARPFSTTPRRPTTSLRNCRT